MFLFLVSYSSAIVSTTAVWKKHEDFLRHNFYKEHTFWTDGYFGFSNTLSIKESSICHSI